MTELIPVALEQSPDGDTPPPEVQNGEWCLVWYSNAWWAGRFFKCRDTLWHFHDIFGMPWQYDKPGHNASSWPEIIWKIVTTNGADDVR